MLHENATTLRGKKPESRHARDLVGGSLQQPRINALDGEIGDAVQPIPSFALLSLPG